MRFTDGREWNFTPFYFYARMENQKNSTPANF